jgi:hypothetical protein
MGNEPEIDHSFWMCAKKQFHRGEAFKKKPRCTQAPIWCIHVMLQVQLGHHICSVVPIRGLKMYLATRAQGNQFYQLKACHNVYWIP